MLSELQWRNWGIGDVWHRTHYGKEQICKVSELQCVDHQVTMAAWRKTTMEVVCLTMTTHNNENEDKSQNQWNGKMKMHLLNCILGQLMTECHVMSNECLNQ